MTVEERRHLGFGTATCTCCDVLLAMQWPAVVGAACRSSVWLLATLGAMDTVKVIVYCDVYSLQAKSFALVLDVLTRFKAADVQKAVETLSSDELDVLMKYIYRGFAEPTENSCGILLTWHEKVRL